jgi:hypothetical protein
MLIKLFFMKRLLVAVAVATIFTRPFFSCQKLMERHYPNSVPTDVNDTVDDVDDTTICRITSFTAQIYPLDTSCVRIKAEKKH